MIFAAPECTMRYDVTTVPSPDPGTFPGPGGDAATVLSLAFNAEVDGASICQ